jgi:hypothetical protein
VREEELSVLQEDVAHIPKKKVLISSERAINKCERMCDQRIMKVNGSRFKLSIISSWQ